MAWLGRRRSHLVHFVELLGWSLIAGLKIQGEKLGVAMLVVEQDEEVSFRVGMRDD